MISSSPADDGVADGLIEDLFVETKETSNEIHSGATQRVGKMLRENALSGHLHERGNRHENIIDGVKGAG